MNSHLKHIVCFIHSENSHELSARAMNVYCQLMGLYIWSKIKNLQYNLNLLKDDTLTCSYFMFWRIGRIILTLPWRLCLGVNLHACFFLKKIIIQITHCTTYIFSWDRDDDKIVICHYKHKAKQDKYKRRVEEMSEGDFISDLDLVLRARGTEGTSFIRVKITQMPRTLEDTAMRK